MQTRSRDGTTTQAEIVTALRNAGCSVVSLAGVGQGVPDLLVGVRGETYLLECKSPGERLRLSQKQWTDAWRGAKPMVVKTALEALMVCSLSGGRA